MPATCERVPGDTPLAPDATDEEPVREYWLWLPQPWMQMTAWILRHQGGRWILRQGACERAAWTPIGLDALAARIDERVPLVFPATAPGPVGAGITRLLEDTRRKLEQVAPYGLAPVLVTCCAWDGVAGRMHRRRGHALGMDPGWRMLHGRPLCASCAAGRSLQRVWAGDGAGDCALR